MNHLFCQLQIQYQLFLFDPFYSCIWRGSEKFDPVYSVHVTHDFVDLSHVFFDLNLLSH